MIDGIMSKFFMVVQWVQVFEEYKGNIKNILGMFSLHTVENKYSMRPVSVYHVSTGYIVPCPR